MERAQQHRSAALAGLPQFPAHPGGSLHFQVQVLGTRLNRLLELVGGFPVGQSAGGDERNVAQREQGFDLVQVQWAEVQPDFGHFDLAFLQ